ncbi:hypothetical protein C7974DRAFT_313370 [Boeremia exigua]|uniref:uncharacterized protein n=1 Tax=Boeremia exigua TaxID=749465 RepID=UPI001E8E2A77|nr:uncharacterized protein C7974DRAFT_313370 [Boeremia exigua]KAH6625697.1 hypothetical protein C7974DRAFT_313370 [Boeremia exigua]
MDARPRLTVPVLQALALVAPSLYTGLAFTYSHVVIPPLTTHAPPKLLAKQWLQAYQFAPIYVAPLILLGASSNALLAYLSAGSSSHASLLYSGAAISIASIIPYTALYMEPGINGAGKWKVQELLRGEFELKREGQGTDKDTARASWKRWAENVDMKTIAEVWANTNSWRYVITSIATVIKLTDAAYALNYTWAARPPSEGLNRLKFGQTHRQPLIATAARKTSQATKDCAFEFIRQQQLFSNTSITIMTNPPWQRLSRDQLVNIIGDYYRFLTKLYIPESALKFPPQEGWPDITQETTKDFPRTSIVIDLLKHLPYIDEANAGRMITNIHYKSDVVDYSRWKPHQWTEDDQPGALSVLEMAEEFAERRTEESEDEDEDEGYLWYRDEDRDKDGDDKENWFDGDDPEDIKMENMIVLADGYESGGRSIILDVFKGNIYEDILECSGLKSEETVEGYFDELKTMFENLVMVPVDEEHFDESLVSSTDNAAQQFRKIYRSFGWPGDAYDKEAAVTAVRAHAQRRHDAMEASEAEE